MIQRLRRRHLRLVALLALAAPLLLALGLAGRRPDVRVDALPEFQRDRDASTARAIASRSDLFQTNAVALSLLRVEGGHGIEVRATTSLRAPDVLVYWSATGTPETALPDDAHLLGRLRGRQPCRARLPTGARDGAIILYSLGHAQRIDSAPLAPLFAAEAP